MLQWVLVREMRRLAGQTGDARPGVEELDAALVVLVFRQSHRSGVAAVELQIGKRGLTARKRQARGLGMPRRRVVARCFDHRLPFARQLLHRGDSRQNLPGTAALATSLVKRGGNHGQTGWGLGSIPVFACFRLEFGESADSRLIRSFREKTARFGLNPAASVGFLQSWR